MNWRHDLIWVDGWGGAVVGVLVLALHTWLVDFYRLPRDLIILMGVANLAYGAYSLSLARRRRRPMAMILFLIFANSAWAVMCFWWTSQYWQTASFFGLLQLLGEGLFVGGLAALEWRWRETLQTADVG